VLNLQAQFSNIHVDEHVLAAYGGKIYAGTDGGLYRFTPQAGALGGASPASWESLNTSTLENFLSESVAYNPEDPFDVLAGHQDNGVAHLAGGEWDWLPNSNESDYTFFDPNPANLGKIAYVYDVSNLDFRKSYDGGASIPKHLIFPLDAVPNFIIRFHPVVPDRFILNFPLGGNQFTVKETANGWEDAGLARDLAPPIQNLGCPTALTYAGAFIYAAAGGIIFQFDGMKWNNVFQVNDQVVSMVVDPAKPNAIYFATQRKVFLKPDQANGQPWTQANGGDLRDLTGVGLTTFISKLALAPNAAGRTPNLYAATQLGIFRTANTGNTVPLWSRMGSAFPDTPISDLQVNPDNRMIYVATYGRGVWYTLDLVVPPPPRLLIRSTGLHAWALEWGDGSVLQEASAITGAWTDLFGATSPRVLDTTAPQKFYRLHSP